MKILKKIKEMFEVQTYPEMELARKASRREPVMPISPWAFWK